MTKLVVPAGQNPFATLRTAFDKKRGCAGLGKAVVCAPNSNRGYGGKFASERARKAAQR